MADAVPTIPRSVIAGSLGLALAAVLLLALGVVVSRGTHHAALRQAAQRAHAQAQWRCGLSGQASERRRCLDALAPAPGSE